MKPGVRAINRAFNIFLLFLSFHFLVFSACLTNSGQTSEIRSLLQPCMCTVSAKSTLVLSFIENSFGSGVELLIWLRSAASLQARPSWIASLLVGGISHSTLDYPPPGCISHSSFVWPSLGGESVMPGLSCLPGAHSLAAWLEQWLLDDGFARGSISGVWPFFLFWDSVGPKTAHLAIVWFRITSAQIK